MMINEEMKHAMMPFPFAYQHINPKKGENTVKTSQSNIYDLGKKPAMKIV